VGETFKDIFLIVNETLTAEFRSKNAEKKKRAKKIDLNARNFI